MKTNIRARAHGAARFALWLTAVFVGIFLAVLAIKLVLGKPSHETTVRLNIAAAIAGILGGLAGVTSGALLVLQAQPRPRLSRRDVLAPRLLHDDRLVDRLGELRELLENLRSVRAVNCHGQRGAGKSFLLAHLADVVNGHRELDTEQPELAVVSAALYFDVADAAGFAEVEAQVVRAVRGGVGGSWDEFLGEVNRMFGEQPVLLILDNMNTPGLWQPLGEAAYRYLAARPRDRLVLGSIDPVILSNLPLKRVALSGLDRAAVGQLAANRGVTLGPDDVATLHDQCDGLPLYVQLFTARGMDPSGAHGIAVLDRTSDLQVIPTDLEPETRTLLAYASLLALVTRQISIDELEHCPIPHLGEQLEVATRHSFLAPIPDPDRHRVKIHDLVRDPALRVLTDEVSEAARFLFDRARVEGRTVDAALFAMFADPEEIGAPLFDDVLGTVIRSAVKSRNYALLSNLHERAADSAKMLRFIGADAERHDLFCYGHASELAGLGRYSDAERELLASSMTRTRTSRRAARSRLEPELRFLHGDIAHLQNRYSEAAEMFEELGAWAASVGDASLRARCTWGHGHVLRHQGRNLDGALGLFARAIKLADGAGELFAKVYSVTGATGIKVLTGAVADDEEQVLADAEAAIAATSAHDGYMLEVWKSQAQVAWFRGDGDRAFDIVGTAIGKALALNDRLLYNLYFERAEYQRFDGQFAKALDDYLTVLNFGRGNGDRNLVSNALLGTVAVDLAAGHGVHHASHVEARATALEARQIALDADIQVTAQTAEQMTSMLDRTAEGPSQPSRLILF